MKISAKYFGLAVGP